MKFKVEVSEIDGKCSNGMKVGDHFFIESNTISIPEGTKICIWGLNKILPIFPILTLKEKIKGDHWIKDLKTMKCFDGKVQFSLIEVD